MLNLLASLLLILAGIVFLAMLGVAALWFRGTGAIALPSLGYVVAIRLILLLLLVLDALLVSAAFVLWRWNPQ
jgi:hypothetical protein